MTDTRIAVKRVALDDVTPAPSNVKAHDRDLIVASLRRFGFADPVVVDQRTGELLAGHGRVEALRWMREMSEDPPAGAEGWKVPVYTGWQSANDVEADAARVALNRTTEAGGWDDQPLLDLLDRLGDTDAGLDGVGFDTGEVDALRARLAELDEPEPAPPAPKPWPHRAAGEATCRVVEGDLFDRLPEMDADSIDAIVCDPPYGLEFMGREWDKFRVDDPGTNRNRGDRAAAQGEASKGDSSHPARAGSAVAYGGTSRASTSRCTGCGKRDQWRNDHPCTDHARWTHELIDPYAAPPGMLAFEEWCRQWAVEALRVVKPGGHLIAFGGTRTHHRLMAGLEDAGWEIRDCGVWLYRSGFPKSMNVAKAIDKKADEPTRDAATWDGWGTTLKPAVEPWVLARRPLSEGTVAANVLKWGTGALNVDGCRPDMTDEDREKFARGSQAWHEMAHRRGEGKKPADVYGEYGITDPTEADEDGRWPANVVTVEDDEDLRFFRAAIGQVVDVPKAGSDEKPWEGADRDDADSLHPTVKPLAVMRHLCRLVTPPGGTVLDPFAGSGTTGEAALIEGFDVVLVEKHPPYLDLIRRRVARTAPEQEEV